MMPIELLERELEHKEVEIIRLKDYMFICDDKKDTLLKIDELSKEVKVYKKALKVLKKNR